MFNRLANYVKYIDIFQEETMFTDRGKKNFRSILGAVLSLMLIVATIVLAVLFGREIYQRKRPSLSVSENYIKNSRVKVQDINPFMLFTDAYGRMIPNIHDYYEFLLFYMTLSDKIVGGMGALNWTIERCTMDHFKGVLDKVNQNDVAEIITYLPAYCFNYNNNTDYFQNQYKDVNSTWFEIDISLCNPKKKKCGEKFDFIKQESYLTFFYINSYTDSLDYENPVKYYYDKITTQLTYLYLKRNFIYISNNQYRSDNGWIIEDTRYIDYYQLYKYIPEINSKVDYDDGYVLWNTLVSPNISKETNRSYVKVQNLFANIGGIVNAFIIIINVFFNHYLRFNFVMSLREFLNPGDQDYQIKRGLHNQTIMGLRNVDNERNEINNNIINKSEKNYNYTVTNTNPNNILNNNLFNVNNIGKVTENNNIINNNNNNTAKEVKKFSINHKSIEKNNVECNDKQENNQSINSINNFTNKLNKEDLKLNNQNKVVANVSNEGINDIEKPKIMDSALINNYFRTVNKLDSKGFIKMNMKESQNSFKFDNLEFENLSYIHFCCSKIFCRSKTRVYDEIRNEIDGIFDVHNISSFLKYNYLLVDPSTLKSY